MKKFEADVENGVVANQRHRRHGKTVLGLKYPEKHRIKKQGQKDNLGESLGCNVLFTRLTIPYDPPTENKVKETQNTTNFLI